MTVRGYWFKSSLFEVEPGEDEEVNRGRYGRQLSRWLKTKLEVQGYQVEPVIAEDWGRCLMCSRDPFRLWVGVGNIDSEELSEELPAKDEVVWHCFPVAEVPFLKGLFKKIDTAAAVDELGAALRSILEAEPEIELLPEP